MGQIRASMRTAQVELLSRSVLWLVLAATIVIAPLTYFRRMADAAMSAEQDATASRKAVDAAKADEEARSHPRIELGSVGTKLVAMTGTEGRLIFTNATPRDGTVCAIGTARSRATNAETVSIASCKHAEPFQSNVEIDFLFAGVDTVKMCPCDLSVRDSDTP